MEEPILSSRLEVMKNGLISGFIDISDIKNWADKKISNNFENYFLIELSMSKNINEVISIINEAKTKDNKREFLNIYFGFFNNILKKNDTKFEKIIDMLYHLNLDYEDTLTDEESSMIYRLEDGKDLAKQKLYGTPKKIKKELKKFLSQYSQFEHSLFD